MATRLGEQKPLLDRHSKRLIVLIDALNKRIDALPGVIEVDAPDSITATDNANRTVTIEIADDNPDSDTQGYRIYRKLSGVAEYSLISDVDTGVISNDYIDRDTTLAVGSTYDYVASAVNRAEGGESSVTASNSATITDTTAPVFTAPAVVSQGNIGRIEMSWTKSDSDDIDYYKVMSSHSKAGVSGAREVGKFEGNSATDYDITAASIGSFTVTVTAYDFNNNGYYICE